MAWLTNYGYMDDIPTGIASNAVILQMVNHIAFRAYKKGRNDVKKEFEERHNRPLNL